MYKSVSVSFTIFSSIAVCDDQLEVCAEIEKILQQISQNFLEHLEIEVFYSGEDLCQPLKENIYFDIIYLDIELKLMTGIDVGKRIREVFLNESTLLTYISGKESYAM